MKRIYRKRNVNWKDAEQKRAYHAAWMANRREQQLVTRGPRWSEVVAMYLPGLRRAA